MTTFIRSLIFNIYFVVVSGTYVVVGSTLFCLMPRRFHSRTAHYWALAIVKGAQCVLGLKYTVEGLENLPDDANYIIASKHQSAFETYLFNIIFKNPAFVLKRELAIVPFMGWQLFLTGAIAIDRSSGMIAMKKILNGAKKRLKDDQPVIIFPEGTRVPYGKTGNYHPGIALLYNHLPDTPVYPVAVNTGKFWKKASFMKYAGTVKVKILPAMPKGLSKAEFMAELQNRIETACREMNGDGA